MQQQPATHLAGGMRVDQHKAGSTVRIIDTLNSADHSLRLSQAGSSASKSLLSCLRRIVFA